MSAVLLLDPLVTVVLKELTSVVTEVRVVPDITVVTEVSVVIELIVVLEKIVVVVPEPVLELLVGVVVVVVVNVPYPNVVVFVNAWLIVPHVALTVYVPFTQWELPPGTAV